MNLRSQQRILAALDANGGVLTPDKASPLGISRQLLGDAYRAGVLARPQRGVYTRPGVPILEAAVVGARLGREALLSHRGAASEYRWDGVAAGVLEWSIPHTRRAPMEGVHLRRRFDELEVVERDGRLMTSPAQTLADLGSVVDIGIVERALESALRNGDVDETTLRAFAAPVSHRPGAPALRNVLALRPEGAPPTESDAETLYLQCIRPTQISEPHRQFQLYDDEIFVARIDFHWWPIRFGVEILGFASHSTPEQLQWDANRSNRVGDRKHLIRYFTYRDVTRRQQYVCRETSLGLQIAQETFPNRSRNRRRAG